MAIPEGHLSPASDIRRIGPNAINQVAEVLRGEMAEAEMIGLFDLARLTGYLSNPPDKMVDEAEVTRLHQVLRTEMGISAALRIGREAGTRTGDYLLANRIPSAVQVMLSMLPSSLASRSLLSAIERHSWTFAGSGELLVQKAFPPKLSIAGCCLCRGAEEKVPVCDYYAATIERLFRKLVDGNASVTETMCQASGSEACTFEVLW